MIFNKNNFYDNEEDDDEFFVLMKNSQPIGENVIVENKTEFFNKFKKVKTALLNKKNQYFEKEIKNDEEKISNENLKEDINIKNNKNDDNVKNENIKKEDGLENNKKEEKIKNLVISNSLDEDYKNSHLHLIKIQWEDYKKKLIKTELREKIEKYRKYTLYKLKIETNLKNEEKDLLDNIKTEKIDLEEMELVQFENRYVKNDLELEENSIDSNNEDNPNNSYPSTPEESDDLDNSSKYHSDCSNSDFGEIDDENEVLAMMKNLKVKPKNVYEEDEGDGFFDEDFDDIGKNLTYHEQGDIEIEY